jgi:TM2 domain-containing membrane protein YozV
MTLTEEEKKRIEEEEKYRAQISAPNQVAQQKHGLPALLSFFIPGLGQMVKGQVGKGILIFIGTIVGFMLLIIPGIIIWLWQIIDAYNN